MKLPRLALTWRFTVAFALLPLAVMITGLLCIKNITYRFGKEMKPEVCRLNMGTGCDYEELHDVRYHF